jgi:diguanylate cyclase (GGDEF)-like protein/PAS domain S-box-containing protein
MLESLLARLPSAGVGAIGSYGQFVPLPPGLELGGRELVRGRTALDLVPADAAPTVIAAFERARAQGAAHASVRRPDGSSLRIYFVDVRDTYGVMVGVFDGEATPRPASEPPVPPRVAHGMKDELAVVLSVDESFTAMLGWLPEDVVGRRALEFVHPDDHQRAIGNWLDMRAAGQGDHRVRLRHLHRDGSWVWLDVTNRNLLEAPEHRCVASEIVDVSDEMAAQEELRASERLLTRLAERTLPIGIVHVDAGRRVRYHNEQLRRTLATKVGAPIDDALGALAAPGRAALAAALAGALERGADDDLELRVTRAGDGEERLYRVAVRALAEDDGAVLGALVCLEDVTERARMQEELERRATYDELTGCLNRAATLQELARVLGERAGTGTAVLFVDLDGFKAVNDRHGHAVGDALLTVAARRLRGAVRASAAVGRLGGDEFVAAVPGVAGVADARAVAGRVERALNRDARIDGLRVPLSASVGVAFADAGTVDADAVLTAADDAMYAVKRARRSGGVAA